MQHVELAKADAARTHLLHGALIFAAPGVGEAEPVERSKTVRLQRRPGLARNRIAPIDQGAENIEEQRFDRDRHAPGVLAQPRSECQKKRGWRDCMSEVERWQTRFSAPGYAFGKAPNAFLKAQAHRLRPGHRALSVADGEGRNGVWLAEQGLDVLAIDFSAAGLAKA